MSRLGQPERYPAAGLPGPALCQINDLALIRQAQRGDYSAFVALARTYDLAVLRIARRIAESEHDAAELYRRTFLRAHKNIASFRFESSLYIWILRFAAPLCIQYLHNRQSRGEGVSTPGDIDGAVPGSPNAGPLNWRGRHSAQGSPQEEWSGRFHDALRLLTPRERMIFELKHGQGFPLRTINEILDIREDAARTSLLRATEKLRNALANALPFEIDEQEETPA